jgi:hypothetical protein
MCFRTFYKLPIRISSFYNSLLEKTIAQQMSQDHIDTHPGIVKVDFKDGSYASRLIAAKVQFVASFRLTIGF